MEFPAGSFPSDRRWIVRIIIAVILGEAVWTLIVSIMNNVIVPWLGDLMGPSAGLPTSFVQRPYNYPELFVSIFEVCIAGLVAAILNYFVQRPQEQRSKSMKGSVVASPSQTFPEPEKAYSPSEVSASHPPLFKRLSTRFSGKRLNKIKIRMLWPKMCRRSCLCLKLIPNRLSLLSNGHASSSSCADPEACT